MAPRYRPVEQHDLFWFIHQYYMRELGVPIPSDHATTVVTVVAAVIEFQAQSKSITSGTRPIL